MPSQIHRLADVDVLYGEARAGRLQDLQSCGHDFGPDAVAMSDRDGSLFCHAEGVPFLRRLC